MKNKKILTTTNMPEHEIVEEGSRSGGFVSLHQLQDGKLNLTDAEYCQRFGRPEEFAELRKVIELRRSRTPAYSYWKCPACGFRQELGYDAIERHGEDNPMNCPNCNSGRYKAREGWLTQMSKKEIKRFLEDREVARKRDLERAEKAGFFARNQERQRQGLEPFTPEQYREEKRQEWQRIMGVVK